MKMFVQPLSALISPLNFEPIVSRARIDVVPTAATTSFRQQLSRHEALDLLQQQSLKYIRVFQHYQQKLDGMFQVQREV